MIPYEEKLRYRKTCIIESLNISSGNTLSDMYECGGAQLMAIILPSNWTTCDLTFKPSKDGQLINSKNLVIYNGLILGNLTLPGTVADGWISNIPYWFNSVPFLQIQCSVAQANTVSIDMVLQPLYQGEHS